jgi:hypothetical protein
MSQVRPVLCCLFLQYDVSLLFSLEATTKLSLRVGGDDLCTTGGCSCNSLEVVYTNVNRPDRYIGQSQLCRADSDLHRDLDHVEPEAGSSMVSRYSESWPFVALRRLLQGGWYG